MARHTPVFYTPLQKGPVFQNHSKTKRTRSPRLMRYMAALALLGLLVVGIQNAYPALVSSDLFVMEKISVDGNRLLPSDEVVAWSKLSLGSNLFDCDLFAATERLRAQPIIENVLLRREPPETLVISLKEREPILLVNTAEGLKGLSPDGFLFSMPQGTWDLPVLTGTDNPEGLQEDALNAVARFGATLRDRDPAFWDDLSEVRMGLSNTVRVYLTGDDLEIRMCLQRVAQQVQNFRAYMNARAYRSLEPAYLDLRYQDQVVVGEHESVEAQLASR